MAVFLAALTFLRLGIVSPTLNAGDNAKHFGILCDVYNVAAASPLPWSVEEAVKAAVAEVDAINASLASESWFTEVERAESKEKLADAFKVPKEEISEYWDRWKAAVERVKESQNFKKLPSTTPAARVGRAKMAKIESEVEKIRNRIKLNNSQELSALREAFDEVLFGKKLGPEGENEQGLYHGSVGRKEMCGDPQTSSPKKGTSAGASLVLDFLCLCGYVGSGVDRICGAELTLSDVAWGAHSASANGKTSWDRVKAQCKKRTQTTSLTIRQALAAIEAFRAAIETGVKATSAKWRTGLLGSCEGNDCSTNGCVGTGSTSNHGVCVYYGSEGSSGQEEIQWLKRYLAGVGHLNQSETAHAISQKDLSHLKMLQGRAEEIYEETKANLELDNVSHDKGTPINLQQQNTATSSDKATAQEPSLSTTPVPHYILPWTFFI